MATAQEQPRRFTWLRVGLTATAGIVAGLALAAGIVILIATWLFNYQLLTVESGSMSPALETGDIVFIRPVAPADVAQRDVILFLEENTKVPILHRVIAVQRQITQLKDKDTGVVLNETTDYNFRTQGDANPTVDPDGVTPDRLRGMVLFYVPTFGLIGSGGGIEWLLLGFGGLMALGWGAWEFYNHRRKAKAKRRNARRPRGAAAGDGREAPAKARILKPRRPSIGRRLFNYSVDRADDAAYLGIVVVRRTGAAMRTTSRRAGAVLGLRTGTGKTQLSPRGKKRAPASLALPHGAGLWLLLPVAVWGAALVVMLAGSAAADYGRPDIPGKFAAAGAASSSFLWVPPGTPTPAPTSAAAAPTPCVAPTSALVTALTATPTPLTGGSAAVAGPLNTAPPLVTVSTAGQVQVTNPFTSANLSGFNPFGFLTPTPKPTRTPTVAPPSVPATNTPTPTPTPLPPTPTPAPQQAPVLAPTPCVQPAAVTATPTTTPTTPTATPTTPTATPTTAASPTASASPSASGTASPSATPTVTPSPTATSAAPASPTVSATPTPTASSTASATASPTATPTAAAASTATATPTPTVTPTATATPIVTPTPTPTATP